MTKLKEILEVYERINNLYNYGIKIRTREDELYEYKRKLSIIQKAQYKTLLDPIKKLEQHGLINLELSKLKKQYEDIIVELCFVKEECNDEILFLINKKKSSSDIGDYYCPICRSEFKDSSINDLSDSSKIIDLTNELVSDKDKKNLTKKEESFIFEARQYLEKKEDATIEEFFCDYIKKEPSKCKTKGTFI